jgi:uncharacterized protein (TIGR03083 family)
MSDDPTLPELYRAARERVTALVLDHPEGDRAPAPAPPGWCVHDLVAHLTGVAEDLVARRLPTGGPTPEWTGGHVARGAGVSTAELLETWAEGSSAVEEFLAKRSVWPVVLDVGAHEHDIRGALGNTGARDSDVVRTGASVLLRGLRVPRPLVVRTEAEEVRVGPEDGEPVVLTTTVFEAFRWRLGRRSRRQLAAMDWSGDPEPYLDSLCVFGPAEDDVVE